MVEEGISVGGFLRWLRWMLPASMALFLVLWLVDLKGMRDLPVYLPAIVFPVLFAVVLGPLVWLRWEHFGAHSKRFWAALGLAVLWAVVAGAVTVVGIAVVVD